MSHLKSAMVKFSAVANVTLLVLGGCSQSQAHPIAMPNPEEAENSLDSTLPINTTPFLKWCNGSEPSTSAQDLTFQALKSFAGSGISCVDAGAYLAELNEIDLSFQNLTDIGPLKDFRSLKVINLSGNQISDLSALAELRNLQDLDVSFQNFLPSQSKFKSSMASLQNSVALLPTLTALRFDGNAAIAAEAQGGYTSGSLSGVSKLKNLEYLSIERMIFVTSSDTLSIQALKDLPKMKEVWLRGNKLADGQCPFANASICNFR